MTKARYADVRGYSCNIFSILCWCIIAVLRVAPYLVDAHHEGGQEQAHARRQDGGPPTADRDLVDEHSRGSE